MYKSLPGVESNRIWDKVAFPLEEYFKLTFKNLLVLFEQKLVIKPSFKQTRNKLKVILLYGTITVFKWLLDAFFNLINKSQIRDTRIYKIKLCLKVDSNH